MIIPFEKLSDEALTGLIDEFILREGTDYGQREYPLSEKREALFKQLKRGDILIAYDSASETCTLLTKEAYKQAERQIRKEE